MTARALPRIVPVMDLQGGVIVRGIAGRRHEYRPLHSPLCPDSLPATLARAFADRGFSEVYLADLDAIGGAAPAKDVYREVAGCGMQIWVDAGLSDMDRARELADFDSGVGRLAGVIAGLESLPGPEMLRDMLQIMGPDRLIFSLDLKGGRPLTEATSWQGLNVQGIAQAALDVGVRRMIVLDLARVGMNDGVGTEDFCRWLRRQDAELEITAGGGVRNQADLQSLAVAGCDAALVASALHDGRIQGPGDTGFSS